MGLLQNYNDMRFEQICSGENLAFFITLSAQNSFDQKRNRLQSCILLSYISVISSKFINKCAQKCQYFTLMDQSIPLITVMSLV